MRVHLLTLGIALAVVLTGCGDDSTEALPNDTAAPVADTAVDTAVDDEPEADDDPGAGDSAADAGVVDAEGGDEASESADDDESDDGDAAVDPFAEGQIIDDLIADAAVDGVVTVDELTEILEVSGVPEEQASCEGALLADLGITDPTDIDALREVASALTEAQRTELSVCISGGTGS